MLIGIPKEIKERENRVAITPAGVRTLAHHGHTVFVQKNAGLGAGLSNEAFVESGAKLLDTAEEVWGQSDMIIKVKEPLPPEFGLMKKGQVLYTYLHLAAEPELTSALLEKEVTAIGYETIELSDGSLPLLKPMSEVAGRVATQVGAQCLEKHYGGKGILLGGVPGVHRGKVTVIGGGAAGLNAAKVAMGMGAKVSIIDVNPCRLAYLDDVLGPNITTLMSNPHTIEQEVRSADLVIGSVLIAGAKAPHLVTEEMVKKMEAGSVIVDIAIDQGGCVEGIKRTTHDNPTYERFGVNHYAVANIPGCVPRTSTFALTNVTLKYAVEIADKGVEAAMQASAPLKKGLNTYKGQLTCPAVAKALG